MATPGWLIFPLIDTRTNIGPGNGKLAAVLAGAQGYVLKNIDSRPLIRSIRAVSNSQSILKPAWCGGTPFPLRKGACWR